MANYDVQVVLHSTTHLPADDVINTLHFEVNAPDTIEGLADGIHGVYASDLGLFANSISGMTVKVYTPGRNVAGPELSRDYAFAPGGAAGPAELAICLSYASVDDPEASLPRRRGRIYLGPLAADATGRQRPLAETQDRINALGAAFAQIGTAANTTWVMYSQRDDAYAKIESVWCDDAWDIQRRRGLRPTGRRVVDVQ